MFDKNRLASEDVKTYAIGDMPADSHSPTALDEPKRDSISVAGVNAKPLNPPSGKIGIDEVSLSKTDEVHIDTNMRMDNIEAVNAAQLPAIIESANHPLSKLPQTDGIGELTPPSAEPLVERPSVPLIRTSADLPKNETASPMVVFVVQPAEDPKISLPAELDALFARAKPAESISGEPNLNKNAETQVAENENADANVRTVSYVEEIPPKKPAESPSEIPPSTQPNSPESKTPVDAIADVKQAKQLAWGDQLQETIRLLKNEIEQSKNSSGEQQICLKLLQILNGEESSIELQDQEMSETEIAYWTHQLSAIRLLLGKQDGAPEIDSMVPLPRQSSLAAKELELAVSELANIAELKISECVFCNQVVGFGQYSAVSTDFVPGQQILIYCELENYSITRLPDNVNKTDVGFDESGFMAEVRGKFSILSADNRVVYQYQYPVVRDTARNRRKDFYMYFPVTLPDLSPGEYQLQLSVEDLVGNKVASPRRPLSFRIFRSPDPPNGITANHQRNRPTQNRNR